jgi:hypothetical protein
MVLLSKLFGVGVGDWHQLLPTKTRAKLVTKTTGSIRTDGLVGAAKTAEEESQIWPGPGPSGVRGGHAKVRGGSCRSSMGNRFPQNCGGGESDSARTGPLRSPFDRGRTGPTQRKRPQEKGKFSQKSAGEETGEGHVPPAQYRHPVMGWVMMVGKVTLLLLVSTRTRKALLRSASVRTRGTRQRHVL